MKMSNEKNKMLMKRMGSIVWLFLILVILYIEIDMGIEKEIIEQERTEQKVVDKIKKGYNLSVDDWERKEAEDDCQRIMNLISDIYVYADKGDASNVVFSDEIILEMQSRVKETGYPVTTTQIYSNMENYEGMDNFLKKCLEGENASIVTYEICFSGDIVRRKFFFDGADMYLLYTDAVWNTFDQLVIAYISYTRIKEWEYTDKGWFCYELCVPEPPEVSEIVDGSCLFRVKPITDEYRNISEKCVLKLGYQGNNLLCSNWDTEHLETLDYNGLYEYLYKIKYQEDYNYDNFPNGVPKDEFENLIMEYLPVTAEQIREYAVFNEESQTYAWVALGCGNYTPTFFGTSVPEVTDIRENEDGTITLTIDAVCDMVVCDNSVISHELTIRMENDGSFQYLGNTILDNGVENIPKYQYRVGNP